MSILPFNLYRELNSFFSSNLNARFFIRSLFALLLTFAGMTARAQTSPVPPRLVVGIMIEGLQQRHVEQLWYRFDENGFRKLVGLGTQLTHVQYNSISMGTAADIATAVTGTTPYYHGFTGELFYNKKKSSVESIVQDDNQTGIGTRAQLSAHYLLSSTFADELMLDRPGKSMTYAIGINSENIIPMGGHTPNSTMWINDQANAWASSSYYQEGLPQSATDASLSHGFQWLSQMNWTPLYSPSTYISNINQKRKDRADFELKVDKKDKDGKNILLKKSPAANTMVTDLALNLIDEKKLGQDADPDLLMLEYTVKTPEENSFTLQNMKKEDMYLRLDKEIQRLIDALEKKVGKDRVLVYAFGNQTNTHIPTELGNNNIPAGYFNANRSMALLSSYLVAMYGPEKWIKGYYSKNIYLDRNKIEDKKLNFADFRQTVADFMIEFEGVQSAFTYQQLIQSGENLTSETSVLKNSTNKKSAGDIMFTLMPGWLELDDNFKAVGEMSEMLSFTPVYMYGWRMLSNRIQTPYQITDLAPSLSTILNIPFPNANLGKPIPELVK